MLKYTCYRPATLRHARLLPLTTGFPPALLPATDARGDRWHDIGYRAGTDVRTPHLDLLASQGVKLDAYYMQPVSWGALPKYLVIMCSPQSL